MRIASFERCVLDLLIFVAFWFDKNILLINLQISPHCTLTCPISSQLFFPSVGLVFLHIFMYEFGLANVHWLVNIAFSGQSTSSKINNKETMYINPSHGNLWLMFSAWLEWNIDLRWVNRLHFSLKNFWQDQLLNRNCYLIFVI